NVCRSGSIPNKPSSEAPAMDVQGLKKASGRSRRGYHYRILPDACPHFSTLFTHLEIPMFRRILFVVFFAFVALVSGANGDEPIVDPTADYLAMNVPDRISNAGHLLIIKRVEVDLEGNGKSAIFLGTWYRHSGPNTWLWAGYAPIAGGYKRITPA